MTDDSYDLVLKGGRVIDPSQGRDEIADVGIRGGKIVRIEPGLAAGATAERELDASGKLVVPGLVDLHTHCYWGGVPLGVNADKIGPATGVTSWVDTGTAGAGNFEGFYYHVIQRSRVRIFPLLHVSHVGLLAISGLSVRRGELFDFGYPNLHELLRVGQTFRHALYGIKVRASYQRHRTEQPRRAQGCARRRRRPRAAADGPRGRPPHSSRMSPLTW